MKFQVLLLTLAFPALGFAQSVNIDKIDSTSNEDTTIQIHKGKLEGAAPVYANTPFKWETQEGSTDVEGEASATAKDAKTAWTKACADWKKEFREDNKENKIVNINCGSASCSGEAGSKICTSKASYKIKTKID